MLNRENKDATLVIASRPITTELKGLVASEKGEVLEITQLSFNQVLKFVDYICSSIESRTKVIEDLRKSPLYSDLPRSPISAILLARLISENDQDIPSTLPELYSKSLEYLMGRWDQRRGCERKRNIAPSVTY